MNIDVFNVTIIVNWTLSVEAFLNFLIFLKIPWLCQKLALAQNLLEKLGEVYTSNFFLVMQDLKLRCTGPLVEPLKPLETFNLVAIL